MYRYLISIPLALALTANAMQPNTPAPDDGAETVGGIPLEVVTRPIPLRKELVAAHQPTSTNSATAQAYYDQGLTALNLFGWIEAARSFHAALEQDPDFVLAWLGLSDAYAALQDRGAAMIALKRAEELARNQSLSMREQSWLELRARIRRVSLPLDLWDEERMNALRADTKAAVADFPEAPEFPFLLGWIMPSDERVHWLHATLEIDPDHAGAHHHLVHRYELDPAKIEYAVKHGERLTELAPSSAHARHMLGHNLGRVGRMEEAQAEFEAADRIERRLDHEEGVLLEYDWHHAHNLSFLVLVNYYMGNRDAAEEALSRHRVMMSGHALPRRDEMVMMLEFGFRLGLGDWDALTELSERARQLDTRDGLAVAEYITATKLIANRQTSAAREAMNRGDAALGKRDLHRILETAREFPLAILSLLDGENEPIESLAERLTDDSNPHSWIRAHWHLDGLGRLMTATGLLDQKEWLTEVLIQHDPNYRGGPLLLENGTQLDDVD